MIKDSQVDEKMLLVFSFSKSWNRALNRCHRKCWRERHYGRSNY